MECYRCLERFSFPLALSVCEVAPWLASDEREPGDEDGEYMVADGVLDLEPVLRDVICLAIPAKRLCSEECGGICPTCGSNLNRGACGCPTERRDSRLKPLEDLKRRMEEKGGS